MKDIKLKFSLMNWWMHTTGSSILENVGFGDSVTKIWDFLDRSGSNQKINSDCENKGSHRLKKPGFYENFSQTEGGSLSQFSYSYSDFIYPYIV